MRLRFNGTFEGINPLMSALIIKYNKAAEYRIQEQAGKIRAKNADNALKNKPPINLDVIINIEYRPRSISANSLMWSLYQIMADAMNKEARTLNKITAQELYDIDMERVAPRHKIIIPLESEPFVKEVLEQERGHVKGREVKQGLVQLEVWETSSYWDSKKMTEHIDNLISDLGNMSIFRQTCGDLDKIFTEYEQWRRNCENTESA